jgi:hypothetical protein
MRLTARTRVRYKASYLGFVMDPVDAEFVVDEVALERVLLP